MLNDRPQAETDFAARCDSARCRICGAGQLTPVLDLGMMPLTADFRSQREDNQPRFPLELAFCAECSLVQVVEQVPAEDMFNAEYPYFSSYSQSLLDHSREHADELIDSLSLTDQGLVIEPASNDGYLLRWFYERGIPVLGIEPCQGPAHEAEKIGISTVTEFFGTKLAERLRNNGKRADLVLANNVLAHVADQNDFVRGIQTVLKDDGVAEIEFPYVRSLIDRCEFDTIYHEHMCYFSLHSVDALFERNGLTVNDVRELSIHGGSLRVRASGKPNRSERVTAMLADEQLLGIDRAEYYAEFGRRVQSFRSTFRDILLRLKSDGMQIAAYGAAAKGVILLNYVGFDCDIFDFVVDRNPHKQGKWMPGLDLEVLPVEELAKRKPDYTVILPWNFKEEIIAQQSEYRAAGGKFIVPIPEPRIVSDHENG